LIAPRSDLAQAASRQTLHSRPAKKESHMSRKPSGAFGELWEIVKTLFWAALIAIVIRTFAYEPFNIPSSSMVPTLLVGDYLFVSKSAYGYSKYSFPGGVVPVEGRIWDGEPQRGEVVVFRPPGEPETDFIKRVIGLPGDRVQVRQGVLHINDIAVQRQRVTDYVDPDRPRQAQIPQYLETLPGGRAHYIIEAAGDLGPMDDTPVYVVPAGHYFMMGDNRDGSNDSRALSSMKFIADPGAFEAKCQTGTIDETAKDCFEKVGFVPKENLIGPAKVLFWSYDSSNRWYNPITWVTALRFGRLFDGIE
jgi:signal peptidase I